MNRRHFLGLVALSVGAAGCNQVVDRYTQPSIPEILKPPGGDQRHPIAHLLNRAAYGARPGQIEAVEEIGKDRWIERQLDYTDIDDQNLTIKLQRFDTLPLNGVDLLSFS